jgi:hypothetical protein
LLNRKWLEDQHLIPPENRIGISFENLQSSPVETVDEIYKHLGDAEPDKKRLCDYIESIKSYEKNSYEELSPEFIQQINTQLNFVFDAFGYEMI